MTPVKIVSQCFWVAAILVTYINVLIFKKRSVPIVENSPEAAKDCNKLLRGFLFWMNLPWVVMGIGCTIGGVPTMFHFFRPRDGGPFVMAWWISILVLYILGIYWMFFCKGAEKLDKYKMIFHPPAGVEYDFSPNKIKLLFLLSVTGGVILAMIMWNIDTPLPTFMTEGN